MGAGWFVQGHDSGPKPLPHGGRALLFAQYQLEEFAREIGLEPLKNFFSSDPSQVAAYFREQGLNPDDFELPEEEWHDPTEALLTVRSLLARLENDPGPVPALEKVRDDLTAVLAALEQFDATGEQFHIATSMPDLSERELPQ